MLIIGYGQNKQVELKNIGRISAWCGRTRVQVLDNEILDFWEDMFGERPISALLYILDSGESYVAYRFWGEPVAPKLPAVESGEERNAIASKAGVAS